MTNPAAHPQLAALEQRVATTKSSVAKAQRAFDQARGDLEQARELHAGATANLASARRFLDLDTRGDIDFRNMTVRRV